MYCVNCGVKLEDNQGKCPLCGTVVYHPQIKQGEKAPMYPKNKMPPKGSEAKALSGIVVILFFLPLAICFFADFLTNGAVTWFGYAAGAIGVAYVMFGLPFWFQKPNPVILVPCNFIATALYLLYVNHDTGGKWFLTFAFPVIGCVCFITCTFITLLYYLRRGRLYVIGGSFIATGGLMLLVEFLMSVTFETAFVGWSVYPLVILVLFGVLLIYLAANRTAREAVERRMFF